MSLCILAELQKTIRFTALELDFKIFGNLELIKNVSLLNNTMENSIDTNTEELEKSKLEEKIFKATIPIAF